MDPPSVSAQGSHNAVFHLFWETQSLGQTSISFSVSVFLIIIFQNVFG